MSDAGQNQEQGELVEFVAAEGGGDSQLVGDLFEGMEEAEDRAGGGLGNGNVVEVAAEETAEGVDAGFRPGGEIEEGAVFDLAVIAEGLAQKDGRRGRAVGDDGDVDNYRSWERGKIRQRIFARCSL